MAEDIVERLAAVCEICGKAGEHISARVAKEAAAEITALRKEVERLTAELEAAREDAAGYSQHPDTWA